MISRQPDRLITVSLKHRGIIILDSFRELSLKAQLVFAKFVILLKNDMLKRCAVRKYTNFVHDDYKKNPEICEKTTI